MIQDKKREVIYILVFDFALFAIHFSLFPNSILDINGGISDNFQVNALCERLAVGTE